MTPLVIELIGLLLMKEQEVCMSIQFMGDTYDMTITEMIADTGVSGERHGVTFKGTFMGPIGHETADEFISLGDLELMSLHKQAGFWALY